MTSSARKLDTVNERLPLLRPSASRSSKTRLKKLLGARHSRSRQKLGCKQSEKLGQQLRKKLLT